CSCVLLSCQLRESPPISSPATKVVTCRVRLSVTVTNHRHQSSFSSVLITPYYPMKKKKAMPRIAINVKLREPSWHHRQSGSPYIQPTRLIRLPSRSIALALLPGSSSTQPSLIPPGRRPSFRPTLTLSPVGKVLLLRGN
ncbi:hypothetical protein L249_3331, partial [Ophiocordyceps polyrhachis-furcata BCC 54312]